MGDQAWVTLATNDSYALGALVLAHSLRRAGTTRKIAVLVTPGVTSSMKSQLSGIFDLVQDVNVLDSKDSANLALLSRPELGITFTKLHCWRLTQFSKCVFLDADTLVLQLCDELFDREELSAAPDAGWPDCFNSGVFVFSPSNETYQALLDFAITKGSFDGGDQGLLNLYFSDWASKDISRHLPFIYNMISTATYSYLPAYKQFGQGVKIVHFIGSSKPWMQYFDSETKHVRSPAGEEHLQCLLQYWWDLFCLHVHSQLSGEMAGLAGAFAKMTLGAPKSTELIELEDHLRRESWERGQMDYLGRDSFDNIWKKILETLNEEEKVEESALVATEVVETPLEQVSSAPPLSLQAEPVPVPAPQAEPASVPAPQAEPAPVPAPQAESTSVPAPQAEPTSVPAPQAQPTPTLASQAVSVATPAPKAESVATPAPKAEMTPTPASQAEPAPPQALQAETAPPSPPQAPSTSTPLQSEPAPTSSPQAKPQAPLPPTTAPPTPASAPQAPPSPTVAPSTPTVVPSAQIVPQAPPSPTVVPPSPTVAPSTPTAAPSTPTVVPSAQIVPQAPPSPTVAPSTPTVAPSTPTAAPSTPTVVPSAQTVPQAPPTPTAPQAPSSPTAAPSAQTVPQAPSTPTAPQAPPTPMTTPQAAPTSTKASPAQKTAPAPPRQGTEAGSTGAQAPQAPPRKSGASKPKQEKSKGKK